MAYRYSITPGGARYYDRSGLQQVGAGPHFTLYRRTGAGETAGQPSSYERALERESLKALEASGAYRERFDPILAERLLSEYQRTSRGLPSSIEEQLYARGKERIQRETEAEQVALRERMAQRGLLYSGPAERESRLLREGGLNRLAEYARDIEIEQAMRAKSEEQQALENLLTFRGSYWQDFAATNPILATELQRASLELQGRLGEEGLDLQRQQLAWQMEEAAREREEQNIANILGALIPGIGGAALAPGLGLSTLQGTLLGLAGGGGGLGTAYGLRSARTPTYVPLPWPMW